MDLKPIQLLTLKLYKKNFFFLEVSGIKQVTEVKFIEFGHWHFFLDAPKIHLLSLVKKIQISPNALWTLSL